ncbi:hypothetical protein [Lacticaseibacillus paracasei]|uniref:hypothetical protein n=1 Tax=Lacticaseibacillus paracasei TaxID=1597 RepID=UPI0005B42838|nr:hypothetical protein [Lacticaseibacillus paracasei]MCT3334571.1 hypothetical protein [Lacticaseibacillus paracasei]
MDLPYKKVFAPTSGNIGAVFSSKDVAIKSAYSFKDGNELFVIRNVVVNGKEEVLVERVSNVLTVWSTLPLGDESKGSYSVG